MTRLKIALAMIIMLFLCPVCIAVPVIIEITAEVTKVGNRDNLLPVEININDLITGTYTYESETPDIAPGEEGGFYEHHSPPAGFSLNVESLVFQTDPENVDFVILIQNDFHSLAGLNDSYEVISENNLPLSNGVSIFNISFRLIASSRLGGTLTALSSDELPTTAPVLQDWGTGEYDLLLQGDRDGDGFYIRAHLTSATVVPEPASFLLLSIGALALTRNRKATRL